MHRPLSPVASWCRDVGGVTDRVNENLQERTWLHNDKPLKKELKGAVIWPRDARWSKTTKLCPLYTVGLPQAALLHLQVLLYPQDHHTIVHPSAK